MHNTDQIHQRFTLGGHMKLILLALAASLLTLVMMVQARSEANDVAASTPGARPADINVSDRVRTRKDMAMWNARRKMHAVRQED
ncbi:MULTISPECIES: hypothetical protein [Pandoraea]|uniref:Uncharacterized protein n=1 Tax=Pandoraea communis TaxID=2508297 RepID=A0A5E4VL92_9BURK|nr:MULTISPECIES: hypothetical protein [Pandoraea]EON11966.1 hypothetical protein C266_17361 [Pandoraea sp. SD6-2]VVE11835.1 hypothetical protein PCO31110_02697 [Pandoraea communis]